MNGVNHSLVMGLDWIIGLIVLVVIVGLVVIIENQKNDLNLLKINSPLDVLKKRYARGKIGKKEYDKKRKLIL